MVQLPSHVRLHRRIRLRAAATSCFTTSCASLASRAVWEILTSLDSPSDFMKTTDVAARASAVATARARLSRKARDESEFGSAKLPPVTRIVDDDAYNAGARK